MRPRVLESLPSLFLRLPDPSLLDVEGTDGQVTPDNAISAWLFWKLLWLSSQSNFRVLLPVVTGAGKYLPTYEHSQP